MRYPYAVEGRSAQAPRLRRLLQPPFTPGLAPLGLFHRAWPRWELYTGNEVAAHATIRTGRSTETSALNKRRAGPARADTFDHFRSFRTMAGHTRHCQYALFVCLACLLASSLLTGSCAPVCLVCVPAPPRGGAGPGPRCLTGLHEDTGGSRDTRDRHKNLTNQPHPPTHAPDHTRTPGRTRRHTPHHSPDQLARWW